MAENQANAAADEAAEPIVGHVTRIQGSVIDVEFPVGHMPDIYNALTVEIKQMGQQEEGRSRTPSSPSRSNSTSATPPRVAWH